MGRTRDEVGKRRKGKMNAKGGIQWEENEELEESGRDRKGREQKRNWGVLCTPLTPHDK